MSNHTDTQPEQTPAQQTAEVVMEAREWDEYYAEMDKDYWSQEADLYAAQWDDDPSPYSGDYSEM